MTDTKLWWQSRTIWAQLVALLFVVLGALKLLPVGLDQGQVVDAVMAVIAVASIVFRVQATAQITGPAIPPAGPGAKIAVTGGAAMLLALGVSLTACAPPQSAGQVAASAETDLTRAEAAYADAKAVAAAFAPFLPADKQAIVLRAEAIAEKALATARAALTLAEQLVAIEKAKAATDQINGATGVVPAATPAG